jgi:hypothetical protein
LALRQAQEGPQESPAVMSDDTPGAAMLDAVRKFATELAELKQQERGERDQLRRDIEAGNTALRHDVYGTILLLDQRQAEDHKTAETRYQETLIYRADDSHWRLNITKMVEQISVKTVEQVKQIVVQNDRKRKFGQWRNTGLLIALLVILITLLLIRVL